MSPADRPFMQSNLSQSGLTSPDSSPLCWSRRRFLATSGTATLTALAGCSVLRNNTESAAFHTGDWHSYGNGPTNSNHISGGLPKPDAHDSLASADWPYAPPVVHDGVVYFASERRVVAISNEGSDQQWSHSLDAELSGAPALDPERDRLYVPTRVVPTTDGPDPAPTSVAVLSLTDGADRGNSRSGMANRMV